MLGHPERNRAEPLGFSGKPDVWEPFEQDPNRDLTMEATGPTSRSNGTSRAKALTATAQLIDARTERTAATLASTIKDRRFNRNRRSRLD
jgi:hypothetical protein